jgi:UDP-N-acetylglucosamine 1-carboxyvinyltransferase
LWQERVSCPQDRLFGGQAMLCGKVTILTPPHKIVVWMHMSVFLPGFTEVFVMNRLLITGGQKIKGELAVEGAKNAVLPILAATILNGGMNVIHNCPRLRDVETTLEILKIIGCDVSFENGTITVDSSKVSQTEIPETLAIEMRSSIIFLGSMLSRLKKVTISYPGECVMLWALSESNKEDGSTPARSYYSQFINIFFTDLIHFMATMTIWDNYVE